MLGAAARALSPGDRCLRGLRALAALQQGTCSLSTVQRAPELSVPVLAAAGASDRRMGSNAASTSGRAWQAAAAAAAAAMTSAALSVAYADGGEEVRVFG